MLIEIFKAGTHTDAAGNTRTWTEEDLDEIISKYNPAHHEAPVVIGHPKDNAPAYGWVEGLERKGSVLYAKLKDLVPEFTDWVKKGLYKKRSISLYPDMTLRHVGFLGAMPPAVKGLADVAFSEAEAVTIEYSATVRQCDRATAERQGDSRAADKQLFNEGGKEDMEKIKELEERLKEKEKALAEFAEQSKTKEEELARLKAELARIEKEKRTAEFNSFCEGLMKEGKLTPAMKPAVMDFMEILHSSSEYEFSDSATVGQSDSATERTNSATVRQCDSAAERFKDFLKALPKQVEFGEVATKDKAAVEGQHKKDIKEMSGWELAELFKNNPTEFTELVEKI